jgi:hypothetical protein
VTARDDRSFPAPTPWYRSKTGEKALATGLCVLIGLAYAALEYMALPWFIDRTAALVLFVSILGMVMVSGHAATRVFGRRENY